MIDIAALTSSLTSATTQLRAFGPGIARDVMEGQSLGHAAYDLYQSGTRGNELAEAFAQSHSSFDQAARAGAALLGDSSALATDLRAAANAVKSARSYADNGIDITSDVLGPMVATKLNDHLAYLRSGILNDMLAANRETSTLR